MPPASLLLPLVLWGKRALALVLSLLAGQAAVQEPYCIIDTTATAAATTASQAPPLPLPFSPTLPAAAAVQLLSRGRARSGCLAPAWQKKQQTLRRPRIS